MINVVIKAFNRRLSLQCESRVPALSDQVASGAGARAGSLIEIG